MYIFIYCASFRSSLIVVQLYPIRISNDHVLSHQRARFRRNVNKQSSLLHNELFFLTFMMTNEDAGCCYYLIFSSLIKDVKFCQFRSKDFNKTLISLSIFWKYNLTYSNVNNSVWFITFFIYTKIITFTFVSFVCMFFRID